MDTKPTRVDGAAALAALPEAGPAVGEVTVAEYARAHRRKAAVVRRYCAAGRLPARLGRGARRSARTWFVRRDAPWPAARPTGGAAHRALALMRAALLDVQAGAAT